MKTQINNWQKRIMISALVIMVLIMGIFAQKSYSVICSDSNLKSLKGIVAEISNNNHLIFISIQPSVTVRSHNAAIIKLPELATANEDKLKVEPWMLNEDHFLGKETKADFAEVEEESIPIEDWMMDETHFMPDSKAELSTAVDQEEEMQVEDWMLDESHFLTQENSANTGSGAN